MCTRVFSPTYPTWALVRGLQGQPAKLYMFVELCHMAESYLYVVENTNIETIINQNVEKLSNVAAKLRFFKLLSLPLQSICRYEL